MKHLKININNYEIGGTQILKNVNLILNENDKISIVGPNGAGKTTLMKIITGEIGDFDGGIENIGGLSIGYLRQINYDDEAKTVWEELKESFVEIQEITRKLDILEKKMSEFPDDLTVMQEYSDLIELFNNIDGYSYESEIHNVAGGIGIEELLQKKISEVSGGQRTKIALAKILLLKPDLLFLDEPTNFIDLKGVEWLEKYLNEKWKNGYFIISHDREFLDKTCNKTLELQAIGREVKLYHGNYTHYLSEREKYENIAVEKWQMQEEYLKEQTTLINRFRAGSRAGWAKSREKQLEKMEKLEKPFIPRKPKFAFEEFETSAENILYFKEVFIGRKDPLFYINELRLPKGKRVGIIGENGVGKSTFIKTILGELDVLEGQYIRGKGMEIGYYSQMHEELQKEKTVWENFESHGLHYTYEQLAGFLNYYLLDREVIHSKVKNLSGGQMSKLLFAILGQKETNLLVLDEPTNHLDYDTREALEQALQKYKGTIIFISHDRYFINKMSDFLWLIKDGELKVNYGNYEDLLYKIEKGLSFDDNLVDIDKEMELVLLEKIGEKELKRLKEKYHRKK
ncbi:MAG: ABC-F family ATP-binding cassette domain-containing protein [Candidatus Gracilibacteria bacterium]|nr:ABC-F family ATP-binding cassette domain-containing protein [Candidatus Gracilibacteria bacterium]